MSSLLTFTYHRVGMVNGQFTTIFEKAAQSSRWEVLASGEGQVYSEGIYVPGPYVKRVCLCEVTLKKKSLLVLFNSVL